MTTSRTPTWKIAEFIPFHRSYVLVTDEDGTVRQVPISELSSTPGEFPWTTPRAHPRRIICSRCTAGPLEHYYTSRRDGQRLCPTCFAERMEAGLAKEGTMYELPFTVTYESHREIRVKLAQEYALNDLKNMADQIIGALNEGFFRPKVQTTPHDPAAPSPG